MSYQPCIFDRDEYLEYAESFENLTLADVGHELAEHSDDIVDIAYELAYSRYRIAKLEKAIRETIEDNLHLADGDVCTLIKLKRAINYT